jgi:hypothetical protein
LVCRGRGHGTFYGHVEMTMDGAQIWSSLTEVGWMKWKWHP